VKLPEVAPEAKYANVSGPFGSAAVVRDRCDHDGVRNATPDSAQQVTQRQCVSRLVTRVQQENYYEIG
jgi:hypothetical protein